MQKTFRPFFRVLPFLLGGSLQAATYHVAATGNDANDGKSLATAVASLSCAVSKVMPGDDIRIASGTYACSTTISFSAVATKDKPITVIAEDLADRPVFDFSAQGPGQKGISLSGCFWIVKGIIIRKAGDNGMHIRGSGNTVEFCAFQENRDSGLQLSNGAASNRIINCDSQGNADPADYGDADGFACKMDVGSGNYFFGCRAWLNCDDGWDGYLRGADNVTTTLENCWTWKNGYFKDGTDAGARANGNGFKMGGSDNKQARHHFILKNCLAFENKSKGFDQNSNKGAMTLYNCTAHNNVGSNYSIGSSLAAGSKLILVNCVELGNKRKLLASASLTTNSWQSPFQTTAADFTSIDSAKTAKPRNPDGSLPDISYMHLAPGSDLIGAGTDIGQSFPDPKPDLGAFQSKRLR